jgi:hypothetical protein
MEHDHILDTSKDLTLVSDGMSLLPSSARTRRRLRIAGVVLGAALGIWAWSELQPAPKRISAEPTEPGAPKVVGRERQVPLRAADRREIDRLLDAFVPAAVERRDPTGAYRLATPQLRRSATRQEWRRGEIPVYPYPASERHDWTLNFSLPTYVSLDLFVQPREGADIGPIAFTVELRRERGRPWLVDSFFPTAMFPKPEVGGQPLAQPDLSPANVKGTSQTGKARLSPAFFLIPFVLLGLVLAIPIVMLVRDKLRESRAERIYALTPRRTMPPLPKPYRGAVEERERSPVP